MGSSIARMRAALVLLAVPLLAGCYDTVAVGDSIMWSTGHQLQARLSGETQIDLSIGRSLYSNPYGDSSAIAAVFQANRNTNAGGTIIVQDDGSDSDYDLMAQFVVEVNDLVSDDKCVVWVAPFTAFNRQRDAGVLRSIEDYRGGQPRSAVARWDLVAESDPGRFVPDGVHPAGDGNQAFAQVVAAAAGGC